MVAEPDWLSAQSLGAPSGVGRAAMPGCGEARPGLVGPVTCPRGPGAVVGLGRWLSRDDGERGCGRATKMAVDSDCSDLWPISAREIAAELQRRGLASSGRVGGVRRGRVPVTAILVAPADGTRCAACSAS